MLIANWCKRSLHCWGTSAMVSIIALLVPIVNFLPKSALRLSCTTSSVKQSMYLSNPRLYEARTTVARIVPINALEAKESKVPSDLISFVTHKVILGDSLFHPQGGGQPSDKGTLVSDDGDVFQVLFASLSGKADGRVLDHYGHMRYPLAEISAVEALKPEANETPIAEKEPLSNSLLRVNGEPSFVEGQTVRMCIDSSHREMSARLHSAGHTIDAALKRCEGDIFNRLKATKGYHFTDGPYVEYDGELTESEMKELPDIINKHMKDIILENIPTNVWMMGKSEASSLLNLSESELEFYPENVRVVEVSGRNM